MCYGIVFIAYDGEIFKPLACFFRFYSPTETIGGGVVLEPNPKIKRRFQDAVIEELKRKESGSTADVIEMHVKAHADTLITIADLAKHIKILNEVKREADIIISDDPMLETEKYKGIRSRVIKLFGENFTLKL